jgi:hypothetical protein
MTSVTENQVKREQRQNFKAKLIATCADGNSATREQNSFLNTCPGSPHDPLERPQREHICCVKDRNQSVGIVAFEKTVSTSLKMVGVEDRSM